MLGLVIDGGIAWHSRRDMQNAADAGAHAGGLVLVKNRADMGPHLAEAVRAAQAAAQANRAPDPDGDPNDGENSAVKITPVCHLGTCDGNPGPVTKASDASAGWGTYVASSTNPLRGVKVEVTRTDNTVFERAVGINIYTVATTATTRFGYASSLGGMLPIVVNLDTVPNPVVHDVEYLRTVNPAAGGLGGSQNFAQLNTEKTCPPSTAPCFPFPGQIYADAMKNGLNLSLKISKSPPPPDHPYPGKGVAGIDLTTCGAIAARILGHESESWQSNRHPVDSPRVAAVGITSDGDMGSTTLRIGGYMVIFIDAMYCDARQQFIFHVIDASLNPKGTDIDPTQVNPTFPSSPVFKLID
jgi:Flp pilus assembly protein TadG